MLITSAKAQSFGGPAGCCGGDLVLVEGVPWYVKAIIWGLAIVLAVACVWSLIEGPRR